MRIAIAGPGRSGTSLLVKLFAEWGFSTPPSSNNWSEQVNAGLESRIGSSSSFEIDKDPWAFEYLHRMSPSDVKEYAALVVPIRDRTETALSRSTNERLSRLRDFDADYWAWNSWGETPGGAVSETHIGAIGQTMAYGLWDLLEKATHLGFKPVLINFPRFATDFEYLWSVLGPLIGSRSNEHEARLAWNRLVDQSLIDLKRSENYPFQGIGLGELQRIVEQLRLDNRRLIEQRDKAVSEQMALTQQMEEMNFRVWRAFLKRITKRFKL